MKVKMTASYSEQGHAPQKVIFWMFWRKCIMGHLLTITVVSGKAKTSISIHTNVRKCDELQIQSW